MWKENEPDDGEHELNIVARYLDRPIGEIAETLMHEMCHQYACTSFKIVLAPVNTVTSYSKVSRKLTDWLLQKLNPWDKHLQVYLQKLRNC